MNLRPETHLQGSRKWLWVMLIVALVAGVGSFIVFSGGTSENDTPNQPLPPNDEIWYTSSDGNVVVPYRSHGEFIYEDKELFGAEIVSNTYKDGKGVIKFDGNVTTIGDSVFSDCNSLTSVTIPNSVETIGEYAFNHCSNLKSVTIPNGVTTIEFCAFQCCSSLRSITIPDGVTTIGEHAFYGCSSIRSITIPYSVTKIGLTAFYGCESLISVMILNCETTIGDRAFWNCDNLSEEARKRIRSMNPNAL